MPINISTPGLQQFFKDFYSFFPTHILIYGINNKFDLPLMLFTIRTSFLIRDFKIITVESFTNSIITH